MEDNKATITASEEELVEMVEKIKQNQEEDRAFAEQLDSFLKRTGKGYDFLHIGKTSNAIAVAGANSSFDMVISPRTIVKCMSDPTEHYHGHAITIKIMEQLPNELRNPVMILNGRHDNTLVAITSLKDYVDREIMVSIDLNNNWGFSEVNRITSVYGRNNMANYLRNQIKENNLIAANKEKADKMLHSAGLQLPLENTFICYDNSITYTTANVKGKEQNFRKNNLKLFINRGEGLFFDNDKINALLDLDDNSLKCLAERTNIFAETNANFEDMHDDYYTKLFAYADFYPNGEVDAWLSLQSITYGDDFYDVPLKDDEKEMLLNDLNDIAVGEGASAAQWLKDIKIEVQAEQEPQECFIEESNGNGRGR